LVNTFCFFYLQVPKGWLGYHWNACCSSVLIIWKLLREIYCLLNCVAASSDTIKSTKTFCIVLLLLLIWLLNGRLSGKFMFFFFFSNFFFKKKEKKLFICWVLLIRYDNVSCFCCYWLCGVWDHFTVSEKILIHFRTKIQVKMLCSLFKHLNNSFQMFFSK
jgi:hypothetical protein